ncbi:MAG: OsmC family peroxiredoxin [candidate division Zixibacteria bacterium]|nr:OsmC family peroxiredoxin [candidate division Zixibacteria bacterium]
MKVTTVWQGKMKFQSTSPDGHTVEMDAGPAVGGEDSGQRPKEVVLSGLAGCTAMDVISLLHKMRVPPESFRVEVEAEQTEEHPKTFSKVHLKYYVKGDVPQDKLKKAIDLSQERYCGVSELFRKGAILTYEYIYEN